MAKPEWLAKLESSLPDILDVKQAASALHLHTRSVKRYVEIGRLSCVKYPGVASKLLIPRDEVVRLIAESIVNRGAA